MVGAFLVSDVFGLALLSRFSVRPPDLLLSAKDLFFAAMVQLDRLTPSQNRLYAPRCV
jgi:hypothetical protein